MLMDKLKLLFKDTRIPIIIATVVILILVAFRIVGLLVEKDQRPSEPDIIYPDLKDIQLIVRETLVEQEIQWEVMHPSQINQELWRVHVPMDVPIPSIHLTIQEELAATEYRILFAESNPMQRHVNLQIGWQDSCYFLVQLKRREDIRQVEGQIAIVIDDFGDRWNAFIRSFLKLGVDITVSVIPGQSQSASIAQQVSQLGAEVILHLPMEPLSASYKDDGYIILADMNQDAVIGVLNRGLEDVPGIVGVNNHMGSRVTSNRRTMTWIMQELHTRGLYFLDSRTFARSVAYQVAREMGLPTGKRDVFLDTDRSREAIKKQVWELVKKSRQNSFAIGIGHCHQETLDVLREEIPKIQEKGYRFVTLSKVIR